MNSLEITQQVFARFGAQDVDGIMELIHDDAHIEFYGVDEIPYAGDYQGKAECRRFFETVLSSVNIHVFEADEFFHQDERVFVVGHLHLTTKRNGNAITSPFVHVIDCRDGKWIHFRDFMNTVIAARAFTDA